MVLRVWAAPKVWKSPGSALIHTAVTGLGTVYLGFQFAGVGGAIGGAVVAFFWRKGIEADASARQKATIASAEEELKSAQETVQVIADRGHVSSRIEVESGEPVADEAGWARGRGPHSR